MAMVVVGILMVIGITLKERAIQSHSQNLFHIFHPVHIFLSATATSAMFWRYEKKLVKVAVIGFLGSILTCGISDVIIPFCSGMMLSNNFEFHLCLTDHPLMIFPFVTIGIFVGIIATEKVEKTSCYSHSGHVFVSSMASILYLIAFGLTNWVSHVGSVFVIIIFAVIIPCCTSDIIFPLLFTKEGKCGE
ncbi:MAG: hypothetical protein D8M57_17070 [Candidatus Scalindua sp. AMX11]|nr:MAG: hypothetical protein DWQ00_12515 [Candidatus Scalindua sp.]TDE63682.1 MAG: hypothetical protein D8M57_17070 [Candidatus Scalindua sp. AMX11]